MKHVWHLLPVFVGELEPKKIVPFNSVHVCGFMIKFEKYELLIKIVLVKHVDFGCFHLKFNNKVKIYKVRLCCGKNTQQKFTHAHFN